MKHSYAPEVPYVSGETVTPGKFECAECGHLHEVPEPRVTNLPVCPHCRNDTWTPARGFLGLR